MTKAPGRHWKNAPLAAGEELARSERIDTSAGHEHAIVGKPQLRGGYERGNVSSIAGATCPPPVKSVANCRKMATMRMAPYAATRKLTDEPIGHAGQETLIAKFTAKARD